MNEIKSGDELFAGIALRDRGATLVQLVTDQIESMIRDGRLVAGDQLPNERELCRQFGVSRTVVREAIARLSAKSLLEVRGGAGGGIVVRSPSTDHVSDSLSLMFRLADGNRVQHEKVLEVRRLLEIEIAALAAERRTAEDLARLEINLAEHAQAHADLQRFAELDLDFHMTLAVATQNELFVVLLNSLRGVLLSIRRLGYSTPGNPQRALRYHRAILEQVKAGNVRGAREAMQSHLYEAEETVHLALALNTHAGPPPAPSEGAEA